MSGNGIGASSCKRLATAQKSKAKPCRKQSKAKSKSKSQQQHQKQSKAEAKAKQSRGKSKFDKIHRLHEKCRHCYTNDSSPDFFVVLIGLHPFLIFYIGSVLNFDTLNLREKNAKLCQRLGPREIY